MGDSQSMTDLVSADSAKLDIFVFQIVRVIVRVEVHVPLADWPPVAFHPTKTTGGSVTPFDVPLKPTLTNVTTVALPVFYRLPVLEPLSEAVLLRDRPEVPDVLDKRPIELGFILTDMNGVTSPCLMGYAKRRCGDCEHPQNAS